MKWNAERASWEQEGFCILEGFYTGEEVAAAERAVAKMFPSAEEMAAGAEGSAKWATWDARWPEFPYLSRTLTSMTCGTKMLDLAEHFLGTDDVRLYIGLATAKYAGQSSGYNRLLHTDFPNNTIVVPRADWGYRQMECFVYLCDVSPANGATHFVSRRKTTGIPVEEHTLNLDAHGDLYDDPTDVSAPAGSVVVYRPDVYHRSVDFDDPTQARFMLHVAYQSGGMPWGGFHAWPLRGYSHEWYEFVGGATPRQLSSVGFPAPGDPYWTPETLEGVGRRYPKLDLTPWASLLREDGATERSR